MNYKYFFNDICEFAPCHNDVDINCLFCFCPLYKYEDCGGTYTILDNGVKDCSNCILPHKEGGYDYVINFLKRKANE